MRFTCYFAVCSIVILFFIACDTQQSLSTEIIPNEYPFPIDNTPSKEKIELGRKLFFDKRLSLDGSLSCADCHQPKFAFTDQKKVSSGIKGQHTERNAPSILNSAFLQTVMFDAHLKTLELQVIVPIQEPLEMGHNMKHLIPILRAIPSYQNAAQQIYNRDFDAWVLTRSIAAFERSLLSMNSRYDKYQRGKKNALTSQEKRGLALFENKLFCSTCHPAPYFTNFSAENNGLYKEYGKDKGRFRINLDSSEIGFFKTPSLRNISLTFPYMHDGSISSIDEVIQHYMKGGNSSKGQHPAIKTFSLTDSEKKDLISFLKSLTDTSYLKSFK